MSAERIRTAVGALRKVYAEHPEKAVGMDSFAVASLTGGLATVVEGPSGQRITTDMPNGVGGVAGAPTPGWYMRAGVASCTATVIAMRAAELAIPLRHLAVRVESLSNDIGMINDQDGIPAGPLEARMSVEISAEGVSRETLAGIVDWGIAHSPIADALTRAVPMKVEVTVGEPEPARAS
jgi:uncharacterized OsmC-like protein